MPCSTLDESIIWEVGNQEMCTHSITLLSHGGGSIYNKIFRLIIKVIENEFGQKWNFKNLYQIVLNRIPWIATQTCDLWASMFCS